MNCQSCEKPRNNLHKMKSKLIPSMDIYLCTDCKKSKYEPRWLVVLAGRSFGAERVEEVVTKRRYLGDEIALKELVA